MRFRTKNNLRFEIVSKITMFPGFSSFQMGGIFGYFSQQQMSFDIAISEITDGKHLTDTIEWFSEMARLEVIPLRVVSCVDEALRKILIDDFDFIYASPKILIKADFLK